MTGFDIIAYTSNTYNDNYIPIGSFKNNKGYGTKKHMEAIDKYGICKYHRLSYYPVSKYAQTKLDI